MIRALTIAVALLSAGLAGGPLGAQAVPQPKNPEVAPAEAATCPAVRGPFRFCGAPPQFTLTPQADNAEVTAYFVTPEAIQAVAIHEPLGLRDGLSVPLLERGALRILANAAGITPEAIPILARNTVLIDGTPQSNFVYTAFLDGANIVYSNSMVLLQDQLMQFVTLDIGATTYTDRHRELHERFLSHVRVDG